MRSGKWFYEVMVEVLPLPSSRGKVRNNGHFDVRLGWVQPQMQRSQTNLGQDSQMASWALCGSNGATYRGSGTQVAAPVTLDPIKRTLVATGSWDR